MTPITQLQQQAWHKYNKMLRGSDRWSQTLYRIRELCLANTLSEPQTHMLTHFLNSDVKTLHNTAYWCDTVIQPVTSEHKHHRLNKIKPKFVNKHK